jgi:hypothetical protein
MNNRKIYLLFILTVFIHAPISAQDSELNQIGTSMANFLKIGMGARATAMGDAFVAISDDITSLYWNPGGLPTMDGNEILFQITDWFFDSQIYYFGISYNFENIGSIGLSLTSFASGDMEETTIWEPDGTGRLFDTNDFAAGLTFARQITERFSAGITVKYISERLDRVDASTIAIDIGSVFVTNFLNNMRIGFVMSNLGGRMKLDGSDLTIQYLAEPGIKYTVAQLGTESWDIPLLFRGGIATDVLESEQYRFTLSAEVMDSRDFTTRMTTGGEIALYDIVFLRGGYKFNYDEADYTLGAGFEFSVTGIGMKLDYAYANYGLLDKSQRFSIIVVF